MRRGIFGWSYPPGCSKVPGDDPDPPCEVCGKDPADCICKECPTCKEAGNPDCYPALNRPRYDDAHRILNPHHDMVWTLPQQLSKKDLDLWEAKQALEEQKQIVREIEIEREQLIREIRLGDLDEQGLTYDKALPQPWVDTIRDRTHINPCGHFVWLYDNVSATFGRPYPLDEMADHMVKGWPRLFFPTRVGC